MPKKFQGENTKAVVARARKNAAREAENEKKQKEIDDAYWADNDKGVQRKQQRKEEKMKKKQEVDERKAQNRLLHDTEMDSIKTVTKLTPTSKVTRAQISATVEHEPAKTGKKVAAQIEEPLPENVNRLVIDGVDARGLDEAIACLSTKEVELDRHPERRMKAAYDSFEESNLPILKAENPNLRLSQLKQMLKKDWMKSPENPLNQRHLAYNERR